MAQNISLLGANYSAVPAVTLPKQGGGTARFDDCTVTTATADDVASGKVFIASDGTITTGTSTGGGGSVTQDANGYIVLPKDGGGGGSIEDMFDVVIRCDGNFSNGTLSLVKGSYAEISAKLATDPITVLVLKLYQNGAYRVDECIANVQVTAGTSDWLIHFSFTSRSESAIGISLDSDDVLSLD